MLCEVVRQRTSAENFGRELWQKTAAENCGRIFRQIIATKCLRQSATEEYLQLKYYFHRKLSRYIEMEAHLLYMLTVFMYRNVVLY